MPDTSRRGFLVGVVSCGALTAATTFVLPGGRPTPAQPPVRLKLLTGADSTGGRKLLFSMWNAANPDTPLDVSETEGATVDQKNFMLGEARSGKADLLNLDIIHLQEFAAAGLISPIELTASRFMAKPLKAGQVSDNPNGWWAAPFNTDVGMLFERVAANAQNPDTPTLSKVLDNLTAGKEDFVAQVRAGSSAPNEAFVVNVLEHALSRDPGILDENGIPDYDHNRWKNALSPLREAIVSKSVWAVTSEPNSLEAFTNERRPRYMRGWPVQYRELQQKNDRDAREGRMNVRPLPVGILGGQSLAVVANSAHQELARRVIGFLTSDESQKVIAAHGLAPTLLDTYNDSNLRAFIPHLEEIRNAINDSRPRAAHRHYGSFSHAVVTHMRAWLAGEAPDLPSKFTEDIRTALS